MHNFSVDMCFISLGYIPRDEIAMIMTFKFYVISCVRNGILILVFFLQLFKYVKIILSYGKY